MTRNRVLIAAAFGILMVLVLMSITSRLSLEKAGNRDIIPQAPVSIPQAGDYELAPSTQSAVELPAEGTLQNTIMAEPQKRAAKKAKPVEVEPEDPGYDSVDSGLVKQPPKSPPPDQLRQMQKQGIVAY